MEMSDRNREIKISALQNHENRLWNNDASNPDILKYVICVKFLQDNGPEMMKYFDVRKDLDLRSFHLKSVKFSDGTPNNIVRSNF